MLLLEHLLRTHWNQQKFLQGATDNQRGNEAPQGDECYVPLTSAAVTQINAALTSSKFWARARVVREVGFLSEMVGRWSEACPCHQRHHDVYNWSRTAGMSCPPPPPCDRKGCRTPELAAGVALKGFQQEVWLSRHNVVQHVHELQAHEQHQLKNDWDKARSKVYAQLSLKLAQWRFLPNILCGLCHPDETTVMRLAQRALQLWEQGGQNTLHTQSRRFLDPLWSGLNPEYPETPLRRIVTWPVI